MSSFQEFCSIAAGMFSIAAGILTGVTVRMRQRRKIMQEQLRIGQEQVRLLDEQRRFVLDLHAQLSPVNLTEEMKASARILARQRLQESLSEEQWRTFITHGWFTVKAKSGGAYRLIGTEGPVGNIREITLSGEVRRWCMHLTDYSYGAASYPVEDHLLAQALLIRTDETAFRATAHPMSL